MDNTPSIKHAEIRLPEHLIDTSVLSLENIISRIPAGTIQYGMKKQASQENPLPQYREVVETFALCQTAALCRFPEALQPFGVKLAVWRNF